MLPDSELRRELQKLGVSVGPITNSTRNLYLKRLEKLTKENDTKLSAARVEVKKLGSKPLKVSSRERSSSPVLRNSHRHSAVAGYSTDESEEDSGKGNHDRKQGVRAVKQSVRSFMASKEIEMKTKTPVHKRVKALGGSRKSVALPAVASRLVCPAEEEDYSDDSDDASESSRGSWVDCQSAETNTTPSLGLNLSKVSTTSGRSYPNIDRSKDTQSRWSTEDKENANIKQRRKVVYGRWSKVLQDVDPNDGKTDVRKSVGNGISALTRKNIASSPVTQELPPKNCLSGRRRNLSLTTDTWTSNFSTILLIGLCIFFIIVGLLYTTMKYDPALNSESQIGFERSQNSTREYLKIASMIYDHVGTYAGKKECDNAGDQGVLKVSDVAEELYIEKGLRNSSLQTALIKFIQTPDWGVVVFDKKMVPLQSDTVVDDMVYIDSVQPILSGWCRLTRAVAKVFFRMLLTVAAGFFVWLGIVYRRRQVVKQQEEREQVYIMVQKIIDVLRKQYDLSENKDSVQPFLPILHVRDMIIPPQDRKNMSRVWEKAKQFLSASETRIRVENQRILGEDYLVWRWIQAASPAKRHTPTSRVWQGEAFDAKSSINRPMICPTPCLKIRNVFDSDMEISPNWAEQIEDSLLEKCQGNDEILRICVEKDSKEGLVYMLCASNQGAGRAFQALHGAWFDGRLITVKFIRLHRFHHRFPDSINQSRVPMHPTSTVPVSTIISPTCNSPENQYDKLYPTLPDD